MKKQNYGLKRNIIDKFYTGNDAVKLCEKLIKKYLTIDLNDFIIEPSAGNGSFMETIKNLTKNYAFYDIEPEHDEILKQDFLELKYDKLKETHKRIHIIGNPPFGRQSQTAIKFIKKSCEFCDTISFILPRSFKKDSMKKHFDKNFHLIHQEDLPENAFLLNGNMYDVPCVFQIWIKKDSPRKPIKKLLPINFTFVKKSENPDISFRRVGVNAGKITKIINDKSEQQHYFIKFTTLNNTMIEKLEKIKFDTNNSVGSKSISKQELIKEFNKILK